MVFVFDEMKLFTAKMLDGWMRVIPEERALAIASYKFEIDKKQHLLAYLLLLYSYKTICGKFRFIDLDYSRGKPIIVDEPDLMFNLSHCVEGVACAIECFNVGVDIQDYITCYDICYDSVLTNDEKEYLKSSDYLGKFTHIWTIKESYGKYKGEGILYDLEMFNTIPILKNNSKHNDLTFTTMKTDTYVITACSNTREKIVKVSIEELKAMYIEAGKK